MSQSTSKPEGSSADDKDYSTDGSSFSDDDGSYIAHYLDEAPRFAVFGDEDNEDEDDPDDPDFDDDGNNQEGNGDYSSGNEENNPGGPPDEPGDPDHDDNVSNEGENDSSSDYSDEEVLPIADIQNNDLYVPLEVLNPITKGHQLLLDFAAAVRHNKT